MVRTKQDRERDPRDLLPLKPEDFHVLLVLAEGARHGYGIMKQVERESGGEVRLEVGSLYRMIARMLEAGLIEDAREEGEGEERRRYYRITRLGRKVMEAEARRLEGLVRVLRQRKLVGEVKG